MLPSHSTSQIHEILNAKHVMAWDLQGESKTTHNIWLLPSPSQLAQFLDIAFFASQHTEEGRTTLFSAEFIRDSSSCRGDVDLIEFETPLPYSPRTLAKLAQAIHSETTHFAVRSAKSPDDLEIWGLIHYGTKNSSHQTSTFSHLHLRVTGIGELRLLIKGRLVYRFSRGLSSTTPGTEGFIHKIVASAANPFLEPLLSPRDGLFYTTEALGRIAEAMLGHHHGGTLLVQSEECLGLGLDIKYRVKGSRAAVLVRRHEFQNRYRAFIPAKSIQEFPLTEPVPVQAEPSSPSFHHQLNNAWAERRFQEAIAFVGQLSAVDGAVVIDENLGLAGFGAFITASAEQGCVTSILRHSITTKQWEHIQIKEAGGARHQSAIRFCQTQPKPAIAIIASQDGGLSLVGKQDKSIRVIPLI